MGKAEDYYWVAYVVGAVVIAGAILVLTPDPSTEARLLVEDRAGKSIEFIAEMIKLVTTLNAAMLAGAAATAINGRDWTTRWTALDGYLILAVILCGAVSYYGVYVSYAATVEMVANGTFNPLAPLLQWAMDLQFYALLFGFLLLGLVFVRAMTGRRATPGQ